MPTIKKWREYTPSLVPGEITVGLLAWLRAEFRKVADGMSALIGSKLYTADAVATFSFAAYGGLKAPNNSEFQDLSLFWWKLDILTLYAIAPHNITMIPADSSFMFEAEGVYSLSVSGSFEHDSNASSRITYIRLYNLTDGVEVGSGLALGTGKQATSTNISSSILVEVPAAAKGKEIILNIGNGDDYYDVNFQSLSIFINAEGEWREPLS